MTDNDKNVNDPYQEMVDKYMHELRKAVAESEEEARLAKKTA